MGDPKGFLKVNRAKPKDRPIDERVSHYREFGEPPPSEDLRAQASRCMDCGIPFCHQGCPLENLIPEWNDLVYRGKMGEAAARLEETNNFPEMTGRVCPAPCEASCVLNISSSASSSTTASAISSDDAGGASTAWGGMPVTIKGIEKAIADDAIAAGHLTPKRAAGRTGRRVAVVGSGPAGLAAAQELARAGHDVTVFEKDDRIGGLLRYGIPDFKLEKHLIDRRMAQMEAEGVTFRTSVDVGVDVTGDDLRANHDAVILCGGARAPRDLTIPGRELDGIHFAMDFLTQQNRRVAGDIVPDEGAIVATGKRVVVIGGGDTGSDCVGTSVRQGAANVMQLELLPKPPLVRMASNPWPSWPLVLRTSSSHEEGDGRGLLGREWAVMTKSFRGEASRGGNARITEIEAVRVELVAGKFQEIAGSSFAIPCDLVFFAMGFVGPDSKMTDPKGPPGILEQLGVLLSGRGNVTTTKDGATNIAGVFAAGDVSRGQSLVVWAIADGRRVAAGVNRWLARDNVRALSA